MVHKELTYGNIGFKEIREFLKENLKENYNLTIYDIMSQSILEVICPFNEIVDAIMRITNIEHDFPAWITLDDELTNSYMVGMNFIKGHLDVPAKYVYINGKLQKI